MAFVLDQSLRHVNIDEQNLHEIYRSTARKIPSFTQCHDHPCDAYVCTSRDKEQMRIYVALYDTVARVPLVFTPASDDRDAAKYKRLLNEALKFAAAQGFTLEKVNLDYSAAMRQVIMRDTKVMSPPAPRVVTSATPVTETAVDDAVIADIADSDGEPAMPAAGEVAAPATSHHAAPEETAPLAAQLADARNELVRIQAENRAAALIARQATAALKKQLDEAQSGRAEAEMMLKELKSADAASKALTALKSELTKARDARRTAQEALAHETAARLELAEELKLLQERIDALQATYEQSREEFVSRSAATNSLLEESGRRESRLQEQLRETHHSLTTLQQQLDTAQEELQAVIRQRDELKTQLAVVNTSRDTIRQEERDAVAAGQAAAAMRITELEAELLSARLHHDEELLEKDLAQRKLSADLRSLNAKLERMVSEKKVLEGIASNFKKKARAAVERLRREKHTLEEELQKVGQQKVVASTAKAASASRRVPAEATAKPAAPPVPVQSESPFAGLGMAAEGGFASFSGYGSSSHEGYGSTFRHNPDITSISYHRIDEIVELYGSSNVVQAAPHGRRPQDCSAYICVVESDGKPRIYLAWHLIDSAEVLVCVPEQQPEGTGSYARTLQDAVFYFESVGFMVDRFELSRGSQRQLQALEKIGICRLETAETASASETAVDSTIPAAA